MPSPPIEVFLTTIASQPVLRQRQEYILRILQTKKIPFTSYDLASDENAKRRWRRKAPADKQQLPGMLVGGTYPGAFADFEEAVECGELDTYLRLKETWDADIDGDGSAAIPVQPIGVPGAVMPLEMTPEHIRSKIVAERTASAAAPLKKGIPVNKRDDLFDVSTELSGFGLQGVQVSEKDLIDLVAELGLDGDEAGDLVKGLSGSSAAPVAAEKVVKPVKEAEKVKRSVKSEEPVNEGAKVEDKPTVEPTEYSPEESDKKTDDDKQE
ncbi:hypothetical protein MIND_00470500 [Mycena indigotica]|uniref:Uncharacterized protein n=1 Tax=Mycena indigotica TaxID=2126181 RepID=A0A8H6SWX4_9AGAR|nr:uncharacterized protein MIND_00470500 [Mycena indigotica]KAF7306788.1 hypothetical protein MIND_00470500 [Mycena indigotica]